MQEIVISKINDEKKIILLNDGKISEVYNFDEDKERLEGNIYLGRARNVVSGIQAAFIDIGKTKNGFIQIEDLIKQEDIKENKKESVEKNIKNYIKNGDLLIVQVKKDSSNNKGVKLSTHIQLSRKLCRIYAICPIYNNITKNRR